MRTHREAEKVRTLDSGMVHQGEHVPGHHLACVFVSLMRLGALAMAAMVERQSAQTLGRDGIVPTHALEILVAIGREAVQQHDRLLAVPGAEFVVAERKPVGGERSHDFP